MMNLTFDLSTLVPLCLLALKIGGLAGYCVIAGLGVQEAWHALRCQEPCRTKLLKAAAYLFVTLKALLGA